MQHFKCVMQLKYTMNYSQNCYIKCVCMCILSNILVSVLTSTPHQCMYMYTSHVLCLSPFSGEDAYLPAPGEVFDPNEDSLLAELHLATSGTNLPGEVVRR